jgi:RNA polymerase sigma factor (sigma-70 family)
MVRLATQSTGSPVHDEDLEQEAALKALEAFQKNRAVIHPRAFLMKIVRDTVRDHWRRRRPCQDLSSISSMLLAQSPALEDALDNARRGESLRQALELLCPQKRLLLQLFYEDDHSVSEIAQFQGRSVSAVKMDLLRARRELAGILRENSRVFR